MNNSLEMIKEGHSSDFPDSAEPLPSKHPPPAPLTPPPRPNTLHGPPKKVILSVEPRHPFHSQSERRACLDSSQPIKARVVFIVTVAISVSALLTSAASVVGLAGCVSVNAQVTFKMFFIVIRIHEANCS